MTSWEPTPKADLAPLSDVYEGWDEFTAALLSRLFHAEAAADWAAAAVADLYARLPGMSSTWAWTNVGSGDTGVGCMNVAITAGVERLVRISKTDATGVSRSVALAGISPGSTVVLTDDPSTPPTTAFRQYVVTSDPEDHGTWISFHATRVATFGTQDTPAGGTTVRILLR